MDECQGFRSEWADAVRFFDCCNHPLLSSLEDPEISWHIQCRQPGETFLVSDGHAYGPFVKTDMVLALKHVCQFVVRVDPGNNQYRVTITDLSHQPGDPGKASYQSAELRFCNSPLTPTLSPAGRGQGEGAGGVVVLDSVFGSPAAGKKPQDTATKLVCLIADIEIQPGEVDSEKK